MINQYDSESDFDVERNESGITITKYTGTKMKVHIPPVIQNLPVTDIGDKAFLGCTGLTSVIIPNGVTYIGYIAFRGCVNLTAITIPKSVTYISEDAFADCTNLTSVTFEGTIPLHVLRLINFFDVFTGDLDKKFYKTDKINGTPGTYTTTAPVRGSSVWTRQKENV